MNSPRRLSDSEFDATFGDNMVSQDPEGNAPVSFWEYFDAIPAGDFQGFDCSEGIVTKVFRESSGRFEHVLVDSNHPNVFMVIVLDLRKSQVCGHHLLNLVAKYGLEESEVSN